MNTHLIQVIAVLVLLIAGWLAGIYFIAQRAKGIRERRFIIGVGIAFLFGIFAFSGLNYFILKSSGAVVGVAMFFPILILRRRQLQIRREEANA